MTPSVPDAEVNRVTKKWEAEDAEAEQVQRQSREEARAAVAAEEMVIAR